MLHFVIAAAIVVGVWHQWILPERRRKRAEAAVALGLLMQHGHLMKYTPHGRMEEDRLRRLADLPSLPAQPPTPRPRPPPTPQQIERDAAWRWARWAGTITFLVLTAYSLATGG